jgi:hypothetical protein
MIALLRFHSIQDQRGGGPIETAIQGLGLQADGPARYQTVLGPRATWDFRLGTTKQSQQV